MDEKRFEELLAKVQAEGAAREQPPAGPNTSAWLDGMLAPFVPGAIRRQCTDVVGALEARLRQAEADNAALLALVTVAAGDGARGCWACGMRGQHSRLCAFGQAVARHASSICPPGCQQEHVHRMLIVETQRSAVALDVRVIRELALEEAAQVVDAQAETASAIVGNASKAARAVTQWARNIATAVRALKTRAPT